MADSKGKHEHKLLEELDLTPLGYVSVAQAAILMGRSEGNVRTMIYIDKRLRAKRVGDRVYVEVKSIDELIPNLRKRGRPKTAKE